MKLTHRRLCAYLLAGSAIVVSAFLWAELVQSGALREPKASLTFPAITPLPSSEHPAAPVSSTISAEGQRRPLLPELHFPSSAVSSRQQTAADERSREELELWGIREAYRLSIPSLSLRAPVLLPSAQYWDQRDWDGLERQMQVGLLSGTVAYPHSVAPGGDGTIIIAGHSSPPNDRAKESRFGQIFAQLPDLKPGDAIVLQSGARSVAYTVTEAQVVPAGDTEILAQQKEAALLKLITCYPVGSTKDRLVVTAELMEQ